MRNPCFMLVACFLALLAGASQDASAGSNQPPTLLSSHASAPSPDSRDVSALPETPGCTVDPERELFMIDLSVVRDCYRTTWTETCPAPVSPATRGAWTMGGLLPGLFGTNDPVKLSNLTRQWLGEWKVTKTINGDTVPARPAIQDLVITPWETASGSTTLDMTKAPFRLQAIVFRLDLRKSSAYSGGGTAGEARFVFTVLDSAGQDTQFNVILEYGLAAPTCTDILTWAQRVHALNAHPFGPEYNAALQSVTDRFTRIGAVPTKPNGSAINQVRSNEIELSFFWELREFKLQAPKTPVLVEESTATGTRSRPAHLSAPPPSPTGTWPLRMVTVAQTPDDIHNFQPLFADFLTANVPAILADNYTVPLSFNGQPFRGGASDNFRLDVWVGTTLACGTDEEEARHIVSLNTCDGCHGGEAFVVFRQVEPNGPNLPATLSGFLTGGEVIDVCSQVRQFNDIERRRVDLCQLLEMSCAQIDAEVPTSAVH